jgi:hypothetical protein
MQITSAVPAASKPFVRLIWQNLKTPTLGKEGKRHAERSVQIPSN